ncbi:MAG TPA: sigma-70 family RNA polymerase sigma factor [Myxococcota bacterium]|nr:sigma-70 family RNA polymerase sigma factor [Myxococcota bacterium]
MSASRVDGSTPTRARAPRGARAAAPAIAASAAAPDEELIARIASGDRAAFALLYARYAPRVRCFVDRRVSNRADAEEISQDVFASVFRGLDSFRGEAPFAAWLFGVTRRTLAYRFRRQRRERNEAARASSGLADALPHAPTPLDHYECRERIEQLERAARALSPLQRRLFEMRHLGDRSVREIASITSLSEDSVKSGLYRARRALLSR